MVQYASGSIRFSGLGSDYDFDGMIGKLAKIEGRQATQLARWKADWQTRLDAFKQLRGELMNLQSSLKKMNSMNSFFAKKAGSSEEKYATAVADADAMNSNYSVDVKKLATYGSWTKDTGLYEKNQVIADDTGSLTYSYKGKYRTVKVAKGTTIEGLVNLINNDSKNLGVRAQLIQSTDGISFQLRGMDTGKSNTLVIRDTQNLNGLDVTLTPVNWADSENKAELINKYSSTGRYDSINTSSETKTFIYTVDDKRHVIDIPPGMNISQLVDAINAETPGIASLVPSDSNNDSNTEYTFTLERVNSEYTANWDANLQQIVGAPPRDFTSPNEKILSAGDPATEFQFTVTSSDGEAPNNVSYKVSITEDTTLNDLVNSLKSQLGDRASVKIVQSPGASPPIYNLEVEMRDKVHRVTVEDGSLTDLAYIQPSSPNWDVRHGENAEVGINGRYLEVASNTIKSGEVIPGMTFMLKKVGETEISVSDDTEKMMENIQEFVTAINNFRTLLTAFTAYDKEKEVVDSEYAESQFDMQKGGVLQGNYGIQMVASSLKQAVASSATGFMPRIYNADGSIRSGDLFSSLSQIGITTNANEGEIVYGLLEINFIPGVSGSKSLEEAINQDPEAVAKLFAAQSEGKSNSDYFHYGSILPGITKAGAYNVKYEVDMNGDILGTATIGGYACSVNNTDKTITVKEGPARGLSINVVEFDQGQYDGVISIKQGKINDILQLLEGSDGILGSNGTMRNLEKNYQGIIDGIESKLKREDERLVRWERTMLLKFSRLETVLSKYNQLQSDLESQIAQLPGKS